MSMANLRMTLAVAHYDRHVPLLDGTVGIPDVDLTVKEVGQSIPGRDGSDRHGRMLNDGEFEAAEVSLSSYLMAKDRGRPLTAMPIVPRRLFCQSLFFVHAQSALNGPEDLAGKRVGINHLSDHPVSASQGGPGARVQRALEEHHLGDQRQ